jgi:hypothetical protein
MNPYRIPYGKHKDRIIDVLPDNVLAGLLWAYRPDGLDNEELHGECFAVLYERHGTARAVVALVDGFEKWARSTKKGGAAIRDTSPGVINGLCPF